MWAFLCGAVSTGASLAQEWVFLLFGVLLAGPFVCGASQAANDWFDRHVDAINEPSRPIPSGRIPGRWGLWIAIVWSAGALLLAVALGPWVLASASAAMVLAWIYSAPPIRLKANGWLGPASVGLSYEGIAWFTGAAALAGAAPSGPSIMLAVLYSVGAFGIMVLNDFKAVDGDIRMKVRTLPVQLGADRAAKLACLVMTISQVLVVLFLLGLGRSTHAIIVAASVVAQVFLMQTLLSDPKEKAPWYNGTGVTLFVGGMLASALAVRPEAALG